MFQFQVFYRRKLCPEEGQENLELMQREIRRNPAQSGYGKIAMGHANISKNPFPHWLQKVLADDLKLDYNWVNFMYYRDVQTEPEARELENWIHRLKENWRRKRPDLGDDFVNLEIKILDRDTISRGDLESF